MEVKVYQDCLELVRNFARAVEETKSTDFQTFCQCWNDLQFQHIYSAQTTQIEVIQTTLAAFHIGKRLLCNRDFNGIDAQYKHCHRVGGLYLLYSIYNKQPTVGYAKIEVNYNTWCTMTEYLESLREEDDTLRGTQQAMFIFRELVRVGAFRHTASDYMLTLNTVVHYDKEADRQANKRTSQPYLWGKLDILDDEMEEYRDLGDTCKSLCELQDRYNKEKSKTQSPQHPALAPTTIFTKLYDVFKDIDKILAEPPSSSNSEDTHRNQLVNRNVRKKAGAKRHAQDDEEFDE